MNLGVIPVKLNLDSHPSERALKSHMPRLGFCCRRKSRWREATSFWFLLQSKNFGGERASYENVKFFGLLEELIAPELKQKARPHCFLFTQRHLLFKKSVRWNVGWTWPVLLLFLRDVRLSRRSRNNKVHFAGRKSRSHQENEMCEFYHFLEAAETRTLSSLKCLGAKIPENLLPTT